MDKKTYNFVKNQLCLTYWWCDDGLSKQTEVFLTQSLFQILDFWKYAVSNIFYSKQSPIKVGLSPSKKNCFICFN